MKTPAKYEVGTKVVASDVRLDSKGKIERFKVEGTITSVSDFYRNSPRKKSSWTYGVTLPSGVEQPYSETEIIVA